MSNSGWVNDDFRTTAQLTAILASRWDIGGVVKAGHSGGDDFYREQAVIVGGMLSADARETEVQRYLRQLEQQVLPVTLHSAEARHAIAVALWRAARGFDLDPAS
ncbi:MAG TPA: hypothetical protein VGM67_06910 [Gemmatimonadaceae bacterium]|jgi:hypothetical protein